MPRNNKTFFTIKYQDMDDYAKQRMQAFLEAFSEWSEKIWIPDVINNTPISSGRDPRENYHPVEMVKKGIEAQESPVVGTPFTIRTLGIKHGANEKRIEIAIQTLHRGWNVPFRKSPLVRSAGQKPFVFRLKDGEEVRHKEYLAAPPTGASDTKDWIRTPIVRQIKQITINKWIVTSFKNKWPRFAAIAERSLQKEPHVPIKTKKVGK